MGTRRYTATRSGTPSAAWLLELDDGGTFHYSEVESTADYDVGADAWGRWTTHGTKIALYIEKSNFGRGRGAWQKDATESGTIADGVVHLEHCDVSLKNDYPHDPDDVHM